MDSKALPYLINSVHMYYQLLAVEGGKASGTPKEKPDLEYLTWVE